MNLETSLNKYRDSSDISISDAQAEWVLTWAKKVLEQVSEEIVKQEVDVEQAPMWKNGYFSALGNSADIIRSFQSPTEKKCCEFCSRQLSDSKCYNHKCHCHTEKKQDCLACALNNTCKEHEEHHD